MSILNTIQSDHIKLLNPNQLVALLRYLLYSEGKQRNSTIHVPLEINVPDGGEDGRWEGGVGIGEYIPNKLTIYQCKAQKLDDADCAKEALKPMARKVLTQDGCFVFFCNQPYVQQDIDSRIEAANKALIKAGQTPKRPDQIRFLDANKIASWVGGHAVAVAYVTKCRQMASTGMLRTWVDWQREPSFKFQFHTNSRLSELITSLQKHLLIPGHIARITGLSGLGKTRLAFEALRPSFDFKNVQQTILSQTTVYLDTSVSSVSSCLKIWFRVFRVVRV